MGYSLIKKGEAVLIGLNNIQPLDNLLTSEDLEITERMKKFAADLKIISPQANDFLYFSAIMMHAAEASLLNDDGSIKKMADGSPVTARWVPTSGGGIKWECSDPNIKPYKNNNNDIFPESELKVAYKKWIGKPLCLDHKSSSYEMVKGVIVDTYWDDDRKRIVALCALDKLNHPDLARKVATKYATNVSMGTGVGRAVCTEEGCHRVAKTEADFCQHMVRKSGYGEINLDLSPIELSLVVTGADPKAQVKTIIAKDLGDVRRGVTALQDYLDKTILSKVASDNSDKGSLDIDFESINKNFEELRKKLDSVYNAYKESQGHDSEGVNGDANSDNNNCGDIGGGYEQVYSAPEPFPTYAQLESAILETREKLAYIEDRLNQSEEKTMKREAYLNGTEEPTPGRPQYPVDPGIKAREESKNLVGKAPFPEVGPVEGLYPGDADIKSRVNRMPEAEKREKVRKAALEEAKRSLQSRAYFNGTEEPTPGRPQYPVDPGIKAREESKNLVGKPPFPEVGPVDGLYPGDLDIKQKVSRASDLKARFSKSVDSTGRLNKAASHWTVLAGDREIFKATVSEISRGNTEAMFEAIANRDFGKAIIKKVAEDGFENAIRIYKGAQAAPSVQGEEPFAQPVSGAPAVPAAPEAAATPVNPEELGEAPVIEDPLPPLGDTEEVTEDLRTELDAVIEQLSDIAEKLGEGSEAVEADIEALDTSFEPAPVDEAGFMQAPVQAQQITVNRLLRTGLKDTLASSKSLINDLKNARYVLRAKYATLNGKQRAYFNSLLDGTLSDSKQVVAESKKLFDSLARYAAGRDGVIRKEAQEVDSPFQDALRAAEEAEKRRGAETSHTIRVKNPAKRQHVEPDEVFKDSVLDDVASAITVTGPAGDVGDAIKAIDPSKNIEMKAASRAERAVRRAKLAQQGIRFSEILDKAHPKGGIEPNNVGKPNSLAVVENLEETNRIMVELAKLPPKVRKQAEQVRKLVAEGKLDKDAVDGLVAYAIDPAAIKFYKDFWAEAKDSESTEFAKLLVQEQERAKTASLIEEKTVKISRAYDLAYRMCECNMIAKDQIPQQVNDILAWNDQAFESLKNVVAKQESILSKTASTAIPQVGLLSSESIILPSKSGPASNSDLVAALDAHFSSKWKY